MTIEEQSREIKQRKAELETIALRSILSGTTWYDVESATAFPDRCGALISPRLFELLTDRQLFSIKVEVLKFLSTISFLD